MAQPERPKPLRRAGGPLRILEIKASVPSTFLPGRDDITIMCNLSRPLTEWEERAAEDNPALGFDTSGHALASMGEFVGRQRLEVRVRQLSAFDLDDYLAALGRLETEGAQREENATEAYADLQRDLENLRRQLEATEQHRD